MRFRHTQRGSFVLNVSCPVSALYVQAPLAFDEADNDMPFVRRGMLALRRSASIRCTTTVSAAANHPCVIVNGPSSASS